MLIQTNSIGSWKYIVFGMGIPPTKFPEMTVSVGLNKDFSSTIHFKNPFKEIINITVTMHSSDNNEVFKLITKSKNDKNIFQVPGMNIIQIPFSFVPREINTYHCEIIISMNDKISWKYPIKGITESVVNTVMFHLKT